MERQKETTILVKEVTWSRIKDHKKLGESNNDVVTRALDALDEKEVEQ